MITIQDFRSDPDSYLAFRDAIANPIVQEALAVLDRAAPINTIIREGISEVEAHIVLGSERGYALYARKLREMAEAWPIKRSEPAPTYGTKQE